jgi:AmmeMemoRadiSam system protein B
MQVIGAKMRTRKPIVAGQFYPGLHSSCVAEINECLEAPAPVFRQEDAGGKSLPETIVAGIVPHAGWTFSGSLAAMVFSTIKKRHEKAHPIREKISNGVNTFVIFGTAHSYFGSVPALDDNDSWETPLGNVAVDTDLAERLINEKLAIGSSSAHRGEHSIEVQIPFIQQLFPESDILPVIAPPSEKSILLGEGLGDIIKSRADKKIVCIGSTDLTHYGPRYGFTPMGTGPEALRWASEVNDRKFIDLALKMEPQALLASAAENSNACGPGAAAAAVAAAKKLGKTTGLLLAQTSSNEVMLSKMGTTSTDSVGYAAIVF